MIDTSRLQQSAQKTKVRASNNIFSELGNNTYDYKDLVSELIDNAIAARRDDKTLKVTIDVYVDDDNKPTDFIIGDNASGIPPDRLGVAITPAGIQSLNSLNEHGLGMKQAVAGLGTLDYLATKVENEDKARVVREFKFGDIPTFHYDVDWNSGTEIAVENLKPIVLTAANIITRSLVPYLGARYRHFLRPDNKALEISLDIRKKGIDEAQYHWDIKEVKPAYFHPSTRTNKPVMTRYALSGTGWKAQLTFGYAPREDEYDELGIEPPKKFHPYHISLSRQGLDVVRNGRVILFHQLSELGIISARHPDYNNIRGEIDLLRGFRTAITKNSIIDDEHFRECMSEVKQILTGEKPGPKGKKTNYLKTRTYPEQIPEKLLRSRLATWLGNNPIMKRSDVKEEYVIQGIDGHIDIFADHEAWEIKTDQASALDVYQLFMYMDVGDIEKGFLVAKEFTTGAKVAGDHIKDKHKKNIVLATREEFPINHPPTASERDDYY